MLADWILEKDLSICSLQETYFRAKDTHRLKMRGWETIPHANRNEKKMSVAILMLDKVDCKTKAITNTKKDTRH